MTISTKFNPLGISGGGGTDAYVQDGLVLHLDGINNGGEPGVWKDLSPEGNDLVIASWAQGRRIYKGYRTPLGSSSKTVVVPPGNHTLETVHNQPDAGNDGVLYINVSCEGGSKCTMMGWLLGWAFCGGDLYNQWPQNTTVSTSIVLQREAIGEVGAGRHFWVNGINTANDSWAFDVQTNTALHIDIKEADLYAVRIYNRPLTPDEVKHNYELDRARFDLP